MKLEKKIGFCFGVGGLGFDFLGLRFEIFVCSYVCATLSLVPLLVGVSFVVACVVGANTNIFLMFVSMMLARFI